MGKPAGTQIRRWFGILVGLLLVVDLAALGGSFWITRSVNAVVKRAEPLAAVTAAMRHEILAAQRELFRYLAEVADDTGGAVRHLESLSERVAEARTLRLDADANAELDAIDKRVAQYRTVLDLLPGTAEGSRDWSRLEEYSATAVALGTAVEEQAAGLAASAREEIRRRSAEAARVAQGAMWGAVAVFTASMLVVLLLRHWWRRFQDLILGM